MADLYRMLIDAGCEVDHHESDLYAKDTQETRRVIAQFEALEGRTLKTSTFISQIDRTAWIDCPFQYTPFWEAKAASGNGRADRQPTT